MKIRTNVTSLNSHRKLKRVGVGQTRASQRLSSGFRVNSAADDAAGLGISEKMRAQIRGLDQAWRNAQDGISLIQTAEGGIATINDMVIRMRELVVQAANDTNVHENNNLSQSDRLRIQDEIDQLIAEIDELAMRLEFNTMPLLSGQFARPNPSGASGASGASAPLSAGILPTAQQLVEAAYAQYAAEVGDGATVQGIQPANAPIPTVVINYGDLVVGNHGTWSFSAAGVLTLHGEGQVFQINGANMGALDRITVQSGTTSSVILNNVHISTTTGAAFAMGGATVDMWLMGNNTMTSVSPFPPTAAWDGAHTRAGVEVTGWNAARTAVLTGHLTINDATGTGALVANGAHSRADHHGGAAGIGGQGSNLRAGTPGGTIIINGGNITANGGSGHGAAAGAGIGAGGGIGGHASAGNITVNGGIVRATGGSMWPPPGVASNSGNTSTPGSVSNAAAIGGSGVGGANLPSGGASVVINGGLVEIPSDHWIGGGQNPMGHMPPNNGTTAINGGNLSIANPVSTIRSGATHAGQPAFRVEIVLYDNGPVPLGAHTAVTYTIGGLTVNAITDSAGRLFMYLPTSMAGSEGSMTIGGVTYSATLAMSANHLNVLTLTTAATGGPDAPTITGPIPPSQTVYVNDPEGDLQQLSVTVSEPPTGATQTIQWFRRDTATGTSTAVGTNSLTHTPSAGAEGQFEYYVVVTNHVTVGTNHALIGGYAVDISDWPWIFIDSGSVTFSVDDLSDVPTSIPGGYIVSDGSGGAIINADSGEVVHLPSGGGVINQIFTTTSSVATVTVNPIATGGPDVPTITGPIPPSQTVHINDPEGDLQDLTITVSAPPDGATQTIQWERYEDGTWVQISGATGTTFTPPTGSIGTTQYRAVVTNSVTGEPTNILGTATSGTATVTVIPAATGGPDAPTITGPIPPSQTVYVNDPEGDLQNLTITVSAPPEGGTQTIQWERYEDGAWVVISGATGATFTPPTGTVGTTQYRAVVTNSISGEILGTATSGTATVTVIPENGGNNGNGDNGGDNQIPRPPAVTGRPLWFHLGANANQGVRLYIEAMDALTLGLLNIYGNPVINVLQESGFDISPLLNILDAALAHATAQRSVLGAMQNRLEFTTENLSIASENLSAANSRIRDADMALEMMRLTAENILQQAATSILAQANQQPQAVLQLLG